MTTKIITYISCRQEVFLRKGVLKICSKFTGEHTYQGVISIKMLCNFIEITLQHGCSPWTISPDNSHLGLLYCPQIITPQQLLPRAMAITNYNFFMALFCYFCMAQLYSFSYDNKNNNDSSNNTYLKQEN